MEKNPLRKPMQIGKVSEIFHIPVSTLHYWEKAGLLSPAHNPENGYAEYDVGDMVAELGDIIFYRSLNISVADVAKIKKSSPEELRLILESAGERIEGELERCRRNLSEIEKRLSYLREIAEADGELHPSALPFRRVVRLDPMKGGEFLEKYLTDPNSFVVVGQIGEGGKTREENCVIVGEDYEGEATEFGSGNEYLSAYCKLLSVPGIEFDVGCYLDRLAARGLKATQYICRFLLAACGEDGKEYDYYKIWFKLKKND